MKTKLKSLLVWLALLAVSIQPAAAKRVALVIGNSNYSRAELDLRNPGNDARTVAESLRKLGFDVILRTDQSHRGMEDALVEFHDRLRPGDVGWFFYAGHGVQTPGFNYLVPVDANVSKSYELKYETVDLEQVKGALDSSGARLKVVVLDCCRDNPFTRSFRSRSFGDTASGQPVPDGMIVTYSTKSNSVAEDGAGNNSPFTQALVSVLDSRPAEGLEIMGLFREVGLAVAKSSSQRPNLDADMTIAKYYLDRPDTAETAGASLPPETPVEKPPVSDPTPQPPLTPGTYVPPVAKGPPQSGSNVTPPGVANTLNSVFASGPYHAFNDYTLGDILRKVQKELSAAKL